MINGTKVPVGWRYNVVFGMAVILLGACAPDTGPGRVSQAAFLILGAFALAQAGSLKQIADGGMNLPVSEITRFVKFLPLAVAFFLSVISVWTTEWIVKLVYVLLISGNAFFFGLLSQRRRAQLDQ
jgi:hypothetical protein